MSDYADLVKRLESYADAVDADRGSESGLTDAMRDAVDALIGVLRERDAARAEFNDLNDAYGQEMLMRADLKVRAEAAEAKVARLREALRVIAACEGKLTLEPDIANAAAINAVARAALEEAKHD